MINGSRACQQHILIQMKHRSNTGISVWECVHGYLLQHYSLLLLEQCLELLRWKDLLLKDLLHLLRCDHLRTHHGHWHWNLEQKDERGWDGGKQGERKLGFQPVSMDGAVAQRTEEKTNKSKLEKQIIKDECQALWCWSTGSLVIGNGEVGRAGLSWPWCLAA